MADNPHDFECLKQDLYDACAALAACQERLIALAKWAIDAGGWRLFYYAPPPPDGIFDLRDRFNPAVNVRAAPSPAMLSLEQRAAVAHRALAAVYADLAVRADASGNLDEEEFYRDAAGSHEGHADEWDEIVVPTVLAARTGPKGCHGV
ncbi:MAG: hypothetical protein IT201_14655 [Thermoleophilia bacterium]|nr:hypothetical protein [Thermoleophilia bacterium]